MGEYTQANRQLQIFTPLGGDVLLLESFAGAEHISQPFHFDLELRSENLRVDFEKIVGQKATIEIMFPDGISKRHINGVVSSFTQGGSTMLEGGAAPKIFAHYHLTLVPWLWLLTRTSDCRIFQNKSVPDILKQIFQEYGLSDFADRLRGSYQPREYCVQYRETDFNFVSRLMEEEGICYFFEHTQDKHTLVLADDPGAFKPCPLQPAVSYTTLLGEDKDEETITSWQAGQEVRPGQYSLNDYNFQQPKMDLFANLKGKDKLQFEYYDYTGEYDKKDEGERLARLRLEEEETARQIISGAGTCRGLQPGFRVKLKKHYRADFNQDYTLVSVYHSCSTGTAYRSGEDSNFRYSNQFQCIPHNVRFRPPRVTPEPRVHGSQTAFVVGPPGEEIYVDKYGRVKVQFHWDREGQRNDKSSCWIRVMQGWAGHRWGTVFLPRIGQEVVVDFLEGDPDQPIITGCVYNATAMPPYALPDHKTKSAIKSNSSKGGGGFNEIRLEDKKGSEQIFIHAEKDEDIRIKNERREWVGKDAHFIVKGDQLEQVSGDKHLTVKRDKNEKVDGTVSLKAGMNVQEKVGMNYALDAGMEVHIKAGMNLVIESGVTLTLKVGGNFININPAGIFIQGMMVFVNSGGAAVPGTGARPMPPKPPKEADKADPGQKLEAPPKPKPPKPTRYSPQAIVMKKAAQSGAPFAEICPLCA